MPDPQRQQQQKTQGANNAYQAGRPTLAPPMQAPHSVPGGVQYGTPNALPPATHRQQLASPAVQQVPQTDLIDLRD
jgi:hypothetical protein